jgi:hypothetical protein
VTEGITLQRVALLIFSSVSSTQLLSCQSLDLFSPLSLLTSSPQVDLRSSHVPCSVGTGISHRIRVRSVQSNLPLIYLLTFPQVGSALPRGRTSISEQLPQISPQPTAVHDGSKHDDSVGSDGGRTVRVRRSRTGADRLRIRSRKRVQPDAHCARKDEIKRRSVPAVLAPPGRYQHAILRMNFECLFLFLGYLKCGAGHPLGFVFACIKLL